MANTTTLVTTNYRVDTQNDLLPKLVIQEILITCLLVPQLHGLPISFLNLMMMFTIP